MPPNSVARSGHRYGEALGSAGHRSSARRSGPMRTWTCLRRPAAGLPANEAVTESPGRVPRRGTRSTQLGRLHARGLSALIGMPARPRLARAPRRVPPIARAARPTALPAACLEVPGYGTRARRTVGGVRRAAPRRQWHDASASKALFGHCAAERSPKAAAAKNFRRNSGKARRKRGAGALRRSWQPAPTHERPCRR